jgi:hypothetical protein
MTRFVEVEGENGDENGWRAVQHDERRRIGCSRRDRKKRRRRVLLFSEWDMSSSGGGIDWLMSWLMGT